MVAPGATVATGQSVMELETDKAVLEVPSSVDGVVQEIKVKEGDKIKVGQVIFTVDGNEAKSAAAPSSAQAAAPAPAVEKSTPAPAKETPAAAAPGPTPAAPSTASGPSEFKLPELGENISQ